MNTMKTFLLMAAMTALFMVAGQAMGATHVPTSHGQIAIDRENKIVTTPCYMLNARVDQIAEGADNLIRAMLEMMA